MGCGVFELCCCVPWWSRAALREVPRPRRLFPGRSTPGDPIPAAGAIHGWGLDLSGEINNAPSETDFLRVAAGTYWSLALRAVPPAVPTLAFDGKLILGALLLGLAFSALAAKTRAAS